jgi:hypothetical protein
MLERKTIPLAILCLSLAMTMVVPRAHGRTHFTFTSIDAPGAIYTEANGVSASGEIVGFYLDSKHVEHGFKDVAGKISTIDFPGATGTRAYGVDLNDIFIVGTYTDSALIPHGFELDNSGRFTTVDVPGAVWTRALSVNSSGTVVGAYAGAAGAIHGFLDNLGRGTFTTLDFPGAVLTEINSIVNLRYMAGIYVDSSGIEHGVQGAAGVLRSPVNVPGAGITSADGVNDGVNVVGHFGKNIAGALPWLSLPGRAISSSRFPRRHGHPLQRY